MAFKALIAAAAVASKLYAAPIACPSALSSIDAATTAGQTLQDNPHGEDQVRAPILHIVAPNGIMQPESGSNQAMSLESSINELLANLDGFPKTEHRTADQMSHRSLQRTKRILALKPRESIEKRIPASEISAHLLGNSYCLPVWFVADKDFLDNANNIQPCASTNTTSHGEKSIEANKQCTAVDHKLIPTMTERNEFAQNSSIADSVAQDISVGNPTNYARLNRRSVGEAFVTVICKAAAVAIMSAFKFTIKKFVSLTIFALTAKRDGNHKKNIKPDEPQPLPDTTIDRTLLESTLSTLRAATLSILSAMSTSVLDQLPLESAASTLTQIPVSVESFITTFMPLSAMPTLTPILLSTD